MHRWRPQWQRRGDKEYTRRHNRPYQYGSGLFPRTAHFLYWCYHCVRLGIMTGVLDY